MDWPKWREDAVVWILMRWETSGGQRRDVTAVVKTVGDKETD